MTEDSEQSDAPPSITPQIGGWLILPGLGLGLQCFMLSHGLVTSLLPILFNGTVAALLDVGHPAYQPRLAAAVLFESFASLLLVIAMLHVLWLFVNRSVRTPRHYIATAIASVASLWLGLLVAPSDLVTTPSEQIDVVMNVVGATFSAGIWITYFSVSTRVQRTFVESP